MKYRPLRRTGRGMDETSLRKIHPAIFTGTYQSRGTPTIGVLLMSEIDDILIQLDRNLTHLCFIRGYPTEFPLSRDMVFSSSTTSTEGTSMTIDHSTLNKGQVRKLNALRKSVGDDIAENAFSKWMQSQTKTPKDTPRSSVRLPA